eukprot:COSAG01_NODE_48172_length_383_cov_1.693662_1_plen_69_part_00
MCATRQSWFIDQLAAFFGAALFLGAAFVAGRSLLPVDEASGAAGVVDVAGAVLAAVLACSPLSVAVCS